MPSAALEPFVDFGEASHAALELLRGQMGMSLWMVTRVTGGQQIILSAHVSGPGYPVSEGDAFHFADTLCARMVDGRGPSYAPCLGDVPAYVQAPAAAGLRIGAYVGYPLRTSDGELFGTLCAIDPEPRSGAEEAPGRLVTLVGRLLATVLDRDLRLEAERRRLELAEAVSMTDELSGLWNRRAWDRFAAAEEARCKRYGHAACVLSIDLDGLKLANDTEGHAAGDALLRRAAAAIQSAVRKQDCVARVGGDEFAVLLVECAEDAGRVVERRIAEQLATAEVGASIGLAARSTRHDLVEAWSRADASMYSQKRARKGRMAASA